MILETKTNITHTKVLMLIFQVINNYVILSKNKISFDAK